jgi:hypothetical protein
MEQWKWDIWEAESRAKQDELEEARAISPPADAVDALEPAQAPTAHADVGNETAAVHSGVNTVERGFPENATKEEAENSLENTTGVSSTQGITEDIRADHARPASTLNGTPLTVAGSTLVQSAPLASSTTKRSIPTANSQTSTSWDEIHEISRQLTTDSSEAVPPASPTIDTSSISHLSNASWDSHLPSPYETIMNIAVNSSRAPPNQAMTTTTVPLPQPPVTSSATGGESIYRTIMNRLTALEANHTLYTRYVEEQTAGVRDVLKRLGEEVGRLEGIVSLHNFCAKILQLTMVWVNRGRRKPRCTSVPSLNGSGRETGLRWNIMN